MIDALDRDPEQAVTRYNVLALSGGGFRGLFSAVVLERFEADLRSRNPAGSAVKLRDQFDLVAGTSVGGLLATGIALGIPAEVLRKQLMQASSEIFPPKRFKKFRQVFGNLYDTRDLSNAIESCISTENLNRLLTDVDYPLLVPAVSGLTAQPKIFGSRGLFGTNASKVSLRDMCLATAAAPTYFKPHSIDGDRVLDGGLIANAPDLLAVSATMKRWGVPLEQVYVLSIGTAGIGFGTMAGSVPMSGIGWGRKLKFIDFMMSAQEQLALQTCRSMLGSRFLRINHEPGKDQKELSELDVVNASISDTLRGLAVQAIDRTLDSDQRAKYDAFLTYRQAFAGS